MLKFDSKKEWYLENKEFLREFERSKEFKDYRNTRLNLRRIEKKLDYLELVKKQIQILEKEKENILKDYETKFLVMKAKKNEAEAKFFKRKIKNFKNLRLNRGQSKIKEGHTGKKLGFKGN